MEASITWQPVQYFSPSPSNAEASGGKKINKSVNLMCFLRHNHFGELCPSGCINRWVHGDSMADSNGFVGVQLLRALLGSATKATGSGESLNSS